ncbi:ABC transporter permease [Acidobacteriota bacterium]
MFKNYLKVALRNLLRHKFYSLLIISGFAIGLAVFLLSALYTGFNFSYDTFHEDVDNIYGVLQVLPSGNKGEQHTAITPAPLLPALTGEFSEIQASTRFSRCRKMIIRNEDQIFYETDVLLVDPNFLSFFNFRQLSGKIGDTLTEPHSIMLSQDSALKYFGETNPLGKTLTLDNKIDVTVTGVIENNPLNSSIHYDFLLSMATARSLYDWMDNWNIDTQAAFIRLSGKEDQINLESKFPVFIQKHFADLPESPQRMYLFPLPEFRKKAEDLDILTYLMWFEPYSVSYFFIGMAVGLLLIVCINFMNLSTARYMLRVREIGMRKVVGATRSQLIKQFLGESILVSLLAIPLALVLYEIIRPAYLNYVGTNIDISLWSYPYLALALFGGTVLLGAVSGSYPALFLSGFNPVQVLKGHLKKGKKGAALRKTLVVSQFVLSILLIIFTVAISQQLRYLMNKNFGFERSDVVVLPIPGEMRQNFHSFKNELIRHTNVLFVSAAARIPVNWMPESQVVPEGYEEKEAWTMSTYGIDFEFTELLNMPIVKGRSFSRDFREKESIVLNETAVKQLGWTDPIGKRIKIKNRDFVVIGVAKDFLFNNAHWKIAPALLYLEEINLNFMFIKTSGFPDRNLIEDMREQWVNFAPGIPFEYSTLDAHFESANEYIEKMYVIVGAIGIIAIFVSCLGLVALASFTVGRRTKEIGVRKVLGASVVGIVRMLLGHFVKLIVLSNVIAWPLTYILLKQFLQWGWAYTADISLTSFLFAAGLSLATAVLSVVFQSVKVAQANPVNALKYE